MQTLLTRFCFGLMLLAATGCTLGASMQVDVEVYKGPLSKTVAVQEEELCAKIVDAERTFGHLYARLTNTAHDPGGVSERARKAACRGYRNAAFDETQPNQGDWRTYYKTPDRVMRRCDAAQAVALLDGSGAAYRVTMMQNQLIADICWAENAATHVLNEWLWTEISSPPSIPWYPDERERKRANYANAAQLGAQLRDRASYWASTQAANPEYEKSASRSVTTTQAAKPEYKATALRSVINELAQFLAETGNQIVSRADALMMQDERMAELYRDYLSTVSGNSRGNDGVTRLSIAQRLATSLYLRDSNMTAYQNLYDWNRNSRVRQPLGELQPLDRVRMVEELMRDTHWSKINTVHANGVGETRMAFIKDDIGNWNLKSFTNDPEELLEAYNDVARGAVGRALSLATTGGAAKNVAKADKLLSFANRALIGEPAQTEPALGKAELSVLRSRIRERLEAERDALREKLEEPEKNRTDAIELLEQEEADLEITRTNIKTNQDEIANQAGDSSKLDANGWDAACDLAPPPAGADAGKLKTACDNLKAQLADEKASVMKIATLNGQIAQIDETIKGIETAAVKSARIVLRDHAIVIGTIEEVMKAKAEDTK